MIHYFYALARAIPYAEADAAALIGAQMRDVTAATVAAQRAASRSTASPSWPA